MSGTGYRFRQPSPQTSSFHSGVFFYPAAEAQLANRSPSALGSGSTTDTTSADSVTAGLPQDLSAELRPRIFESHRNRGGAHHVTGRLQGLSLDSGSCCPTSDSCSDAASGSNTAAAPRKSHGYRKLWEQVTKVKVGQELGKGTAGDFSDMTVEDLVKIVSKLTPKESAVHAVCQGLYYLDSSAMAALLKDLCRKGLSSRAVEIFEWLRKLEQSHELRPLCDVYTYTTMVSQCGSHQQLRNAMELMAEMKTRGIKCNVRTYTAFMNVCIKVNEIDLALDVYRQMLQENITPNLVTYNTLIDIYGKKNELDKAIEVLDTLDSQGIHAEVRTYNTVITACSRSGNPEQALSVYNRMLRKDVQPTATTYTALISAYGKRGQVDKALEIFQDMVQRGCERNVITYSSLIGACEKGGRWELAIQLFQKMNQENCRPNAITYNSLIATCANCGRWSEACEMFNRMVDHGWLVDCSIYLAVLGALSHGGPWTSSLSLYEDMLRHNFRPDGVTINAVLETLWQSGVESARSKAIQLSKVASEKGIIWSMEYLVVVWTSGAAIISMMQWLLEMRQHTGGNVGVLQNRSVTLTMQRGRQCSVAQDPVVIHAAIASILSSFRSPFSVLLAEDGIQLCAPVEHVSSWLQTQDFWSCVEPVVSPMMRQSSEQIIAEDKVLQDRCCGVFQVTVQYEKKLSNITPLLNEQLLDLRRQYVKWALSYTLRLQFKEETVHDALLLFDRVLTMGLHENQANMQLVICVCLLMVANLCEDPSTVHSANLIMNLPPKSVADLQAGIRAALGDEVGVISSLRVIQLYQERLGNCAEENIVSVRSIIQQTLLLPQFMKFTPSVLGAAVLYVVRKQRGLVPFWPNALVHMTGYTPSQGSEFAECVQHVDDICEPQQSAIPGMQPSY